MKKQIVYIVELKKAYEDKHYVHLVMGFPQVESCSIGYCYMKLLGESSCFFVEKHCSDCAYLSCHEAIHRDRDLKPENFLLLNEDENSPLRTIDFGLSDFYKPGDVFKDIVGDRCLLHSTRGFEKEFRSCYLKYWCHIVYHLMWCLTLLDW